MTEAGKDALFRNAFVQNEMTRKNLGKGEE